MDSVEIRGLSCRCIIGIRARERRVSQRVRIDLKLSLDLERAGKTGRIAHTVDYSRASSELIALLQFRRYSLLEVAAEECAGWLFAAYPMVQAVAISMFKPQALAGQAESGGVRISRQRPVEATRVTSEFGFVQSQLETAEASISVVGLEAGRRLPVSALGADSALVLPLSDRLEGPRPMRAHEAVLLKSDEACENRDAVGALLVVCAQKSTSDRP